MSNKKKIIIICTMVVMLVAAAYLNVLLGKKTQTASNTNVKTEDSSAVSVFSAMKSDRDSTRAQNYGYLDAIISSETSSQTAKEEAESKKMQLIGYAENELVLENLIKARGFEDACVTMSTGNVNVVVKDGDLNSQDVAQILWIVTEETGCSATDVVVVPYSVIS